MSTHLPRPPHHGHDEPEDPVPGMQPIAPDDGVAPLPGPGDPEGEADTPPV